MRAIVLEKFGGLDSLVYKDIPEPEPKAGHVVIQIEAFGLNHAELHMRRGEWAEAAPVSGIECVGLVKSSPGGEFPVGAKVAALMGGLGRTINGSYAEYTRVPVSNVALIESELPWAELAAIPETYATAWTCLFRNLEITKDQTLVIRGATSSFGQAALKMLINAGAIIIATTRSQQRFAMVQKLGASRVELEGPDLSQRIAEAKQLDAVLDLVGNSTILDSLAMLRRGRRACLAGWLGGLAPIADFNPLLQMANGVYLLRQFRVRPRDPLVSGLLCVTRLSLTDEESSVDVTGPVATAESASRRACDVRAASDQDRRHLERRLPARAARSRAPHRAALR